MRLPCAQVLVLAVSLWLMGSLPVMAEVASQDPLSRYSEVMGGDDSDAKRTLVAELARARAADGVILPLLVDAVSDRQTHDDAVRALRQRTGLTPPVFFGQSHYPGYPSSDYPASWQSWMHDWQVDHQDAQAIDQALADAADSLAQANQALRQVRNAR